MRNKQTNEQRNARKKNKVETNNASIHVVVVRVECVCVYVSIVLIKESTHMLIIPIRKLIHMYVVL